MTFAPVSTYSILGCDPTTGDIGIAVASRYIAVGSLVPHVRAGVGAVASQSIVDPRRARIILDEIESGVDPERAITAALAAGDVLPAPAIGGSQRTVAGEDFAHFLRKVPGCFFFLGSGNTSEPKSYPHHHPRFDIAERVLQTGVEMFVRIIERYAEGR